MEYDYSKLIGKIVEKYGSQKNFANAMEMSERSLSLKLNNIRSWNQPEIIKASSLLGISQNQLQDYFFKIIVQ